MATNQGCVLSWWHPLRMPGCLSTIQVIWATYCFDSSCASLKFFLECPFWSQVLCLVWEPRLCSLFSTARLFEFVLLASSPVVVSTQTCLPQLLISFPLASTRLRARYCASFGLVPSGYFEQGFSLFFKLLFSREGKTFGSALRWFHLRQNSLSMSISFKLSWQRTGILQSSSLRIALNFL